MAVGTRMQQRRALNADWNTSDYVLAAGELGVATDTGIIKIGDGVNGWTDIDPAFNSQYLPLLGTAADSDLLNGISSAFFVKVADTSTTATADKYVKRTATGTVKAVTAAASDDVTTKAQMDAADLLGKRVIVGRTVTAAATLALTDVNTIMQVNHSSRTARVVVTVPLNSSVAFVIGDTIEVMCAGTGGAKISGAGGVTITGKDNVMPGYGTVRLTKVATDTWYGLSLNVGKQLPKIKAYRNAGGQSYTNYTFVPYNVIDTVDTYNPDNEWFSIPGSGLSTARRIIVNKDGEYHIVANFSHAGSPGQSWTRIWRMVNDNTETGGVILAISPTLVIGNVSTLVRATAGQSFGIENGAVTGATDVADTLGGGALNPNHFMITRLGD